MLVLGLYLARSLVCVQHAVEACHTECITSYNRVNPCEGYCLSGPLSKHLVVYATSDRILNLGPSSAIAVCPLMHQHDCIKVPLLRAGICRTML